MKTLAALSHAPSTRSRSAIKTFQKSPPPTPDGLVSEGEFLDITEIKRQQAEDYECITHNGVAPPDQRKVKVTVNCECAPDWTPGHPIT